ncbi:serine/threonine-protein kinase [Embleya sp. NPDC008237]|uniref:serine/threonine-protein kinase n=1 Tax=Embleya sp. NPDC008237 TaxID=3363978 RepID=UPI0036ECD947
MERGELVAGRYELLKRLGRGGMGEVWAGRDRVLHRDVAVKMLVLDAAGHADLPRRFEREAVAAAQINHPNVVALYDRGIHEDLWFLVMERVEGANLAEHVRDGEPIDPARALAIAQEVCAALVAAHRAGVVHYDIKPHNVMITPDGAVKVVDFGIAGFLQTAFTLAASSGLAPAGTPQYGAPEQFLTDRGDARSDLYALGSVLFALLAGRPPFIGPTSFAIMQLKLTEDAPRLDTLCVGLPPALTDLVAALLERDPGRRPRTAEEVHEHLYRLRTALAASDTRTATTVTATRTRRTPPPRIERRPTRDGAFDISWTGREPITDYASARVRTPVLALYLLILLAIAATSIGVWIATDGIAKTPSKEDNPWDVLLVLAIVAAISACAMPFALVTSTRRNRRHRNALPGRAPWSLHVGPDGIVTTDVFSRTVTWEQAKTVTVETVFCASVPYSYPALHVYFVDSNVTPLRPAGWFYAGTVPSPRWGRVPLCVLGPLTEQQHFELTQALARHAGPRWRPQVGSTTTPRRR